MATTTNISGRSQAESLSVSSRNLTLLINFCTKRGIPEEQILSDLGYTHSYLKNPDRWIPLSAFVTIAERVCRRFGDDPSIIYQAGLTSAEERLGVFEALKKILALTFTNPRFFIEKIPEYNRFFNRTKNIELISLGSHEAFFKIVFLPEFDPTWDFISGPFMKGVLGGIPCVWGLPPAQTDELVLCYDVVRLLREKFKVLAELKNGALTIEGVPYGRLVSLVENAGPNKNLCLGRYQEAGLGKPAVLITKDFFIKSYPLLIAGQLYNAPYTILRLGWQTLSFRQRLINTLTFPFIQRQLALRDLEEQITYFQNYTKELENLVDQRSSELIGEKAEVEKWKQAASKILVSHLPPAIAESMIRGKLQPRKNTGTILFADLVGFTERLDQIANFSQTMADLSQFFEKANFLIKAGGGWVYKYLGDGALAVFGGYQRDENKEGLARQALEVSQKLIELVGKQGWQLRIGLEHGDFIAGEVGPPDERVWDFLGTTINLAARLQQHAQPNEILMGPNIYQLLQKEINVQAQLIDLKGLGQRPAYRFIRFQE